MLRYGLLLLLAVALYCGPALSQDLDVPESPGEVAARNARNESFTVGDIRVVGLQRISEGTVFNYLPINIGDRLSPVRIREAIRALYNTGFFRDIQFRRDGNTLIIAVLERPSIESFEISGNKDIKTEDLQKSLRNVGLAAGKIFDRSVLEDVRSYLTDQYFSRGKYAVRIDESVQDEPGNRVKIKVTINEGKRAKIREINVVGNHRFTDKEIISGFELHMPNWLSWYKQDDRYSRESLQGDLEKLRSFYMDRGYANFQIDSTQVQISPEKDDIFITINIEEGEVFKISKVKLAGTFVVPEPELAKLVLIAPGQIFSRKLITASQELMQNRLGQDGYAFAKVEPVPTANGLTHEVALTFFVDPGNRVYVRNISFSGVTKINDDVLRRELRQLEGGWLSNAELERSKQRIQRLPYVKKVDSTTTPVPGSPDQVDVDFKIEEGPGAQISGGVGYSQLYKLTLNGNYTDANFLGTGERFSIDLEGGAYNKVYSISQTDPYATINGLVRTISVSYRDVSQFIATSSQFSTKLLTAGLSFSYPLSEYQFVSLGADVQDAQLVAVAGSSSIQAQQWVLENGSPYRAEGAYGTVLNPLFGAYISNAFDVYGTRFVVPEITGGWTFDSRNKTLFADRGTFVQLSGTYVPPTGNVQYWKGAFNFLQYIPLIGKINADLNFQFGYGQGLGNTTALPPYALFYGGGPDSVRGFYPGSLGPRDQFGNPYGGNINVLARAEVILPMPEKFEASARVKLFFDAGNVFSSSRCVERDGQQICGPQFYGPPQGLGAGDVLLGGLGPLTNYNFSYNHLKDSVGVSVEWLAPLGLFRFSFAVPLNARPENDEPSNGPITWGDNVERFQFDMGQAF
ncbi:MAG TPA: outer membrane protein assembly factor BamA [Steroidobacteraceae bacterium]|nr:outer membrane protein assembly factor BamA [Steroidobacteraceae bacterium]